MTQIIDFSSYAGRRKHVVSAPSAGAEILFFLGVRYERMPEPVLAQPAPKSRAAGAARTRRKRPA